MRTEYCTRSYKIFDDWSYVNFHGPAQKMTVDDLSSSFGRLFWQASCLMSTAPQEEEVIYEEEICFEIGSVLFKDRLSSSLSVSSPGKTSPDWLLSSSRVGPSIELGIIGLFHVDEIEEQRWLKTKYASTTGEYSPNNMYKFKVCFVPQITDSIFFEVAQFTSNKKLVRAEL